MCIFLDSLEGPNEERLIRDIFETGHYQRLARPVAIESEAVEVQFGLTLMQIISIVSVFEFLKV